MEMMMIRMDKTYRTRDGRLVRIYALDGGGKQPIHGSVKDEDGSWKPISWCSGGTQWGERIKNDYDLIEVKPRIKHTVWINVYPDGCGRAQSSKNAADAYFNPTRLACVKVEIDCEEGEGL
jgi:hypothetical protein